jgi:hypothetical protein
MSPESVIKTAPGDPAALFFLTSFRKPRVGYPACSRWVRCRAPTAFRAGLDMLGRPE